jgi:hypothetical protein
VGVLGILASLLRTFLHPTTKSFFIVGMTFRCYFCMFFPKRKPLNHSYAVAIGYIFGARGDAVA